MKIALTVDVEDWYQTNDFNIPLSDWDQYEDRVVGNTEKLLQLFSRFKVKGTFFILGCVAERHPNLIRQIASQGHEIGSHGGFHRMVNSMSKEEFIKDIRYSKTILEEVSGQRVTYFRAPSWSLSRDRLYFLEILESEGFTCDSSIQPFQTPLSGINGVPHTPYYPIVNGRRLEILEYPPTVYKFGKLKVPFSGGFYLRFMPFPFISWALKQSYHQGTGMVYVHPWEIDSNHPRLEAKQIIYFIHYYNLHSTQQKLEKLLSRFHLVPVGEKIRDEKYPTIAL